MDINMPGLDGIQTVEEIQRRSADEGRDPNSVLVMMLTSSNNLLDRQRATEFNNVLGYIQKPLDGDGILHILELNNSLT